MYLIRRKRKNQRRNQRLNQLRLMNLKPKNGLLLKKKRYHCYTSHSYTTTLTSRVNLNQNFETYTFHNTRNFTIT